jgi:predicted restriction endonuclease
MKASIPCIKHGVSGTADVRLHKTLELSGVNRAKLLQELSSLVDFDGQLWATWRDEAGRRCYSEAITKAWAKISGAANVKHLIPSDENFDYQEDCMNDPN